MGGSTPYDFKTFHKLIGPFLRVIWHGASAVIANSQGLRALARAFDSSIEIPIIPNGVDGNQYRKDSRDWTPARLFSVGRIVHQKGLDLGLRALAQLKDLDWHWNIAGDGPQLDALKSLANELGLSDRVTFLGRQSRAELTQWYIARTCSCSPRGMKACPTPCSKPCPADSPWWRPDRWQRRTCSRRRNGAAGHNGERKRIA